MKKFLIVLVLLLTTIIVAEPAGITDIASQTTVVATVNEQAISINEFLAVVLPKYTEISNKIEEIDPIFASLMTESQPGNSLLKEYEKVILNDYIDKVLLLQYSRTLEIIPNMESITEKVHNSIMETLNELNITEAEADMFYVLRGYIGGLKTYEMTIANELAYNETINTLFQAITGAATVSEEEISQYYDINIANYTVDTEQVALQILLFDSFSEAYSVWKETSKQADPLTVFNNFEDSIKGSYTRSELEVHNKDLVDVLFKNTSGELVPSVVTFDDRYAVIYLSAYTPAGVTELSDVREDIVQNLIMEKSDLYWQTWYQEHFAPFKEQSNIELFFDEE